MKEKPYRRKFEPGFNIMCSETISDAHQRLKEGSPKYAEECRRLYALHTELEKVLEDQQTPPPPSYWTVVQELLELQDNMFFEEHTATYIQGALDCIHLLYRLGQMHDTN